MPTGQVLTFEEWVRLNEESSPTFARESDEWKREQYERELGQSVTSGQTSPTTVVGPDGEGGSTYIPDAEGGFQAVPYGVDPRSYAGMTPEERAIAQIQGEERRVRDENQRHIDAAQERVDGATASVNQFMGEQAGEILGGIAGLNQAALGADMGSYARLDNAAATASGMDLGTLDALTALFGGATAEEMAAVGDFTGAARGANDLSLANYDALNTATQDAFGREAGALGHLEEAYGDIGRIDPGGYGADLSSEAASAAGDQRAIDAQFEVLDEYGARSGVGMTDQERYIMELARRNEEQDRRNAMQAQLSDLNARGMGGSGAEIGAMLGAQSTTSQNRMLQDMAALASAQQRSERMLGARGDLAGQIRDQSYGEQFQTGSAADAMSQFNRSQSLAQTRWQDEFNRAQNLDAQGMAQDLYGARTGATGRTYDRAGNLYGAGGETIDSMYGREGDLYDARTGAVDRTFNRGEAVAGHAFDVADDYYTRDKDVVGTGIGLTDKNYNRGANYYETLGNLGQQFYDRHGDDVDSTKYFTALRTGQNVPTTRGGELLLGKAAKDEAIDLIDDDEGIFGNIFGDIF